MNLCASTQVAMNVFHMIRNSTLNLISTQISDHLCIIPWVYYHKSTKVSIRHMNNEEQKYLSELLQGDYSDVRVHDVIKNNNYGNGECRLVEFHIKQITPTGHINEVIFLIRVGRKLNNGNFPSWTRRGMEHIEIILPNPENEAKTQIRLHSQDKQAAFNYTVLPYFSDIVLSREI